MINGGAIVFLIALKYRESILRSLTTRFTFTLQEKVVRALITATSRSPSAARDAIRAMRGQLTTAYRSVHILQ